MEVACSGKIVRPGQTVLPRTAAEVATVSIATGRRAADAADMVSQEAEFLMASRALKIDPKKTAVREHEAVTKTTTEQSIAALAYQLWMERGCPIGSPEVDWFQAETELKMTNEPASMSA